MASPSNCDKCSQQTREPHFLRCDHFFCYRCVVTLYNEYVIATKMQTQKQGPTQFPCGVVGCQMMTPVPLGGLRNLPRSCQMTGALADLGLDKKKMSSPSHCNKCTQETSEPHFLECGHFFCYGCVITLYIERKMQPQKQGPTYFCCGVEECQKMTEVPEGGLRNLPRSSSAAGGLRNLPRSSSAAGGLRDLPRSSSSDAGGLKDQPRSSELTGVMADLSLDSTKKSNPGAKHYEGYKLRWRREDYGMIQSLAVMGDGSCLVITTGDGPSTTQQRLSPDGKPTDLPFPCFAKMPSSVSINQSSTTVVVVDGNDEDDDQVCVYNKQGDSWQYSSFTTRRNIWQTAITDDICIVCVARSGLQWTLVLMSGTGQEEWTRSLPEGNIETFIGVSKKLIVVSSMNSDTVTVVSRQGDLVHTFPTAFISLPSGVTSDSTGRLVIADRANQSISLFTPEGHFIKTLVKCQGIPVYINLSQDRFLLVGEITDDKYDLCLYELH